LKSLNRTVEYVLFEGEGHGFRKGENVKKALETEREFYEKIFRLEAAE
jgi:dipeptidyl aminopeptidase/acylaminoacyl peptidase